MPTYNLVNPLITGSFVSSIDAKNHQLAAKEFYNKLSPHFNNIQHNFVFTIQKATSPKQHGGSSADSNDNYYSFNVNEVKKDDDVIFTISSFNGGTDINKLKTMLTKFNNKSTSIDTPTKDDDNPTAVKGGKRKSLSGGKQPTSESESDAFNSLLKEIEDEKDSLKSRTSIANINSSIPLLYDPIIDLISPFSSFRYMPNIYTNYSRFVVPSFYPTAITPDFLLIIETQR